MGNHLWHLVTMAAPKIALQPVDRAVADAAHAELTEFVNLRNPGVVDKRPDTVLNFDKYLKPPELQKTTAVVRDFLDNTGKKLAADFLQVQEAKLERSFLVLYCARQSRQINTGLGKVTIFLAFGPLSPANGLPKFMGHQSKDLESGDALLVESDLSQMLDKNAGGGFALVSDWTA